LSTASWPLSQYLHFCRQVYLDHIPPSHSTARGCLQFHSRLEGTDPLATMPEQSRVTSQHHPYLARGPTRGLDRRQNEPEEINVALIGTLETRLGHEHEEKAKHRIAGLSSTVKLLTIPPTAQRSCQDLFSKGSQVAFPVLGCFWIL
jgi:hypothetical protein